MKIKLSKKKTEDSQVRSSLQQTIFNLNQTQNSKIDFHATTSFRDVFSGTTANKPGHVRGGPMKINLMGA